ncbi:MAG: ATP-binding protein [Bacilli bacterium]|nr:ATP-binding protein [Bacilli bacterium]
MDESRIANIAITCCCFLFISLLAIMYFSKKNMKNYENKIYKHILVWSILNLIFYMAGGLPFLFNKPLYFSDEYSIIIGKFTGCATVVWFAYFALYIQVVAKQNKKKKSFIQRYKYAPIFVQILIIILAILAFTFHMGRLIDPNGETYIGGPAAIYYWLTSTICVLISVITLITNLRGVPFKKAFPLLLITFLLPASIIANGMVSLSVLPLSMTLVSYLMYFTIENPDLKLINELTLAKNQAEQASNAKSDFLSSMSHELRTPLNAIVGLSQMIKTNENLEEIHTDSDDIIVASENLLELVDGILDINKLETNQMELVKSNYHPVDVINDLIKMIDIRIGEKNLQLRTNFSKDIPYELSGDKDKLKRIISNLLTNAVKYTEEGYIDFNISCTNIKDKCNLKVEVKDTGRGISEERIPELFTKFNRLESDKDSDIQGTGLGLAITKSLVDLVNGKIQVESKLGEGTTFTVTLTQDIITQTSPTEVAIEKPIHSEINAPNITNTELKTQNIEDNTPESNKKILVVDDNKLNLKVASKILESFNFDVETSNSGFECIDKITNQNRYDIIFMDIMMPEMDGVETMKKLKNMSLKTPIVALTADAVEGSRERYLDEGFDDYVAKPIDQMTLEETLHKLLDLNVITEQQANTYKENYNKKDEEDTEIL